MKKIILVENDAAIRDAFSLAFDQEVYQTVVYESGDTILRNTAEVPDIFVIDKNISGMNGLEVCSFIKASEQYKGIPVIILSASPDIKEVARQANADDAIAKPFSLKDLREVISKYTSN
ncbi:MAG: response regulator [Flavipsychrobacter sp.]